MRWHVPSQMKLHKKVTMTPVTKSVQNKWWNLLKILNKWRLKYAEVQSSHKVHQWAIILRFLPTIWLFQFSWSSSEEVGFFFVVHIMRVGTHFCFLLKMFSFSCSLLQFPRKFLASVVFGSRDFVTRRFLYINGETLIRKLTTL